MQYTVFYANFRVILHLILQCTLLRVCCSINWHLYLYCHEKSRIDHETLLQLLQWDGSGNIGISSPAYYGQSLLHCCHALTRLGWIHASAKFCCKLHGCCAGVPRCLILMKTRLTNRQTSSNYKIKPGSWCLIGSIRSMEMGRGIYMPALYHSFSEQWVSTRPGMFSFGEHPRLKKLTDLRAHRISCKYLFPSPHSL